jgi:hypothetical protein
VGPLGHVNYTPPAPPPAPPPPQTPSQDLKGVNPVKLGGLTEDLLLRSMKMHDERECLSCIHQGRGGESLGAGVGALHC